ncbi:MAG: hypothetical protein J6O55_01965 [Lachnospiraceae bacterium]|nr:hypothetical protein [Lachnospiraceae bacterium]
MSDGKNNLSPELDGKEFKKTERVFERAEKLEDDALEEVAGGFISKKGYSEGLKIVCPNCGKKRKGTIISKGDDGFCTDYFYCNNCGTFFGADDEGHIYETEF